MSEKIVYLSGAMMDCTDAECKDWREEAKQLLNCATRDPAALRDYRGREHEAIAEVVEDDKADIDTCTFVLVNYIKPSVGTSMEILLCVGTRQEDFGRRAPRSCTEPLAPVSQFPRFL